MKTITFRRAAVAAVAFLVPSVASAQILEVPTQFPTIQAAVDAAPDGASITVLPGQYAPFAIIGKSLSIHGAGSCPGTTSECPGGVDVLQSSPVPGVTVRSLPAGGQVVVSGLRVRVISGTVGGAPAIKLQNCAGTVLLADVVNFANWSMGPAMLVEDSDLVVLDRVQLRAKQGETGITAANFPALQVTRSGLWAANSNLVGGGGGSLSGSCSGASAGPAIIAEQSTLYLAECQIVGGNGGSPIPHSSCAPWLLMPGGAGGPGIRSHESVIKLVSGDVSGGFGGCGGLMGPGGVGIEAHGSSALVAGTAMVVGGREGCLPDGPLAVPFAGEVFHFVAQSYPVLAAGPGPLAVGGALGFDVSGEPGAPVVLVVGLRSGPVIALAGIDGAGLVDLAHIALLVPIVLDASGAASVNLPLPALPQLAGTSFVAQGVVLGPQFPAFTNPVVIAGAP